MYSVEIYYRDQYYFVSAKTTFDLHLDLQIQLKELCVSWQSIIAISNWLDIQDKHAAEQVVIVLNYSGDLSYIAPKRKTLI